MLKLKTPQNPAVEIQMMEEELFLQENVKRKKKNYAIFKSNELEAGIYNLQLEYRNRDFLNQDIYIFQGINTYQIEFPQLKLNYNF